MTDLTLAPSWFEILKSSPTQKIAFEESWIFYCSDADSGVDLFLRLNLTSSSNGYRKSLEACAHVAIKNEGAHEHQTLRQVFPIDSLAFENKNDQSQQFRFGSVELLSNRLTGTLFSRDRAMQFDLVLERSGNDIHSFNTVPLTLKKLGLLRGKAEAVQPGLRILGKLTLDKKEYLLRNASGMLAHSATPRSPYSWLWAYSNQFVDSHGKMSSFLFQGAAFKTLLMGTLPLPWYQAFSMVYQGEKYEFNALSDSLQSKSQILGLGWNFQIERGDLMFKGAIQCSSKEIFETEDEDSSGTLYYRRVVLKPKIAISVYRYQKIEAEFTSIDRGIVERGERYLDANPSLLNS